jgi:DNA-binding Lrp family transcriptional regulator
MHRLSNHMLSSVHYCNAIPSYFCAHIPILARFVNTEYTKEVLQGPDVLVALKLAAQPEGKPITYEALARSLGMSASGVHKSMQRAAEAKLINLKDRRVNRSALIEFLVHGIKYMFPPEVGRKQRGLHTAYSAEPLASRIASPSDDAMVWPYTEGTARGESLKPIYASAPLAASKDPALYELLACVDAIRIGGARIRQEAERLLRERLTR